MAPETLVLEITEGMVLDSAPVRCALDRLAALGVSIAIDDFGTGYSALSIIRTLPLDIVKLDKSFLSNGPSHAADEAVVAAIVQMAGSLGLCVIAEGVERPDQQRFLRSVGVDAAQGTCTCARRRPTGSGCGSRAGRTTSRRAGSGRAPPSPRSGAGSADRGQGSGDGSGPRRASSSRWSQKCVTVASETTTSRTRGRKTINGQ
jgi:predicted signal transduction protein with EAL and GGDEF domain